MILGWISDPPPREHFQGNYGRRAQAHEQWPWEKELTDERAAQEQRRWQFEHLSWFGVTPPESMRPLYERLAQEFPPADHVEFSHYVTEFVGPSTPAKSADLLGMSVEDLVSYLRDWQPSREFMGASREGLGREFTSVVGSDPNSYAKKACSFKVCHLVYVRSLFHGLRDSVGRERLFEWRPVLELCAWVVIQKDADISGGTDDRYWAEEERDWSWTRNAIAYLLEVALSGDKGKIPFELRHEVWSLLANLSNDPDPTSERENKQLENNTPPSEVSINAARGVALHAIVHYALWVRNQLAKAESDASANVVDEMSEVRNVLDIHLVTEVDPSLSIRSVYGRWFPWLHFVDKKWATERAQRIFPDDPDLRLYWEAAWGPYLTFCPAYDDVFMTLRSQYELAVDRLGQAARLRIRGANLEANLGAHLMGVYLRGKMRLDDPLLVKFFSKAPVEARGYAIETLGRWLVDLKKNDQVTQEIRTRLAELWKRRLAEAIDSTDKTQYAREIASFTWWFRSGAFDDHWTIRQLEEVLSIAAADPKVLERFAYSVLQRLAEVCAEFPDEAIRCLERITQAKESTWYMFANREPIAAILSSALSKGGEAARLANNLINELGRRGHSEYRDLLMR